MPCIRQGWDCPRRKLQNWRSGWPIFYLKEKGSVAAELQQGSLPGFGAENTWAEQMKQDLANIFAYLTQLDHTLTQHKEERS